MLPLANPGCLGSGIIAGAKHGVLLQHPNGGLTNIHCNLERQLIIGEIGTSARLDKGQQPMLFACRKPRA